MFMIFRKKQMVMTALVLMLGIAGYLNYRYDKEDAQSLVTVNETDISEPGIGETVMVSSEPKTENEEDKEEDFFAAERLERDRARAKACDELKKTLESADISDEAKAEAEKSLTELIAFEEKEATAQNLLGAKGFGNTLVHITNDSVTVNIRQNGISRSDTAKIVDIIYELTQNNNIKIVEVN